MFVIISTRKVSSSPICFDFLWIGNFSGPRYISNHDRNGIICKSLSDIQGLESHINKCYMKTYILSCHIHLCIEILSIFVILKKVSLIV